MMEIYAACYSAKCQWECGRGFRQEIESFAVAARSREEAVGTAMAYAKDICKIEDGWYEHQVSISRIPSNWIAKKLAG